ncbi:MAG TPA: RodZ domain-containing protein [Terriglobales bacterium]|nr:RodZ domain-containing protein [Terriglobales bacterium]
MGNFGERLKKTRENRKITLDEVAKSTKISTRMLRALEEEKFNELPGGVFNKGFVRAYARHLGLDEEKTLTDYMAAIGGDPEPAKPEDAELRAIAERKEKERQASQSVGLPWGALAVLLLLVALGLAVWGFYSREQVRNARVHRVPDSSPAVSGSAALPDAAPADAAAGPQTTVTMQAASTAAPSSTPAPLTTSYNPSATPAPGSFVVLIIAHENSWVSISADGKSVYSDTLVAPGERSVQASQQVILRAGNPGGLAVFFNGKKLPPMGEDGEAKTFTFGANGLESQSPSKTEP